MLPITLASRGFIACGSAEPACPGGQARVSSLVRRESQPLDCAPIAKNISWPALGGFKMPFNAR